jgi:glycosyltransferase involved in cell wall biosynthesis
VTSAAYTSLSGLRFAFCMYYWPPYRSGMTLDLAAIAAELARRGAQVAAIVGRHDRALPRLEERDGVLVRRLAVAARYDRTIIVPGLVPAFARAARRADVAVIAMPLAEAPALVSVAPRGATAAYYICDPALPGRGRLARALIAAVDASARVAVRRADLVVATSADYAQHSRVLKGVAGRVLAIPPILDLERMRPPNGQTFVARGDAARIGYLGRLTHEKGLDLLIRAAARLSGPVRIVLAGDSDAVAGGGERRALDSLAHELGVTLEYRGPLRDDEVPAFLASLDVFALPSVSTLEAWGRVQAEAMLCGTPVVASALPGVRELVRATGMGKTVTPGDVAGLAAALEEVIAARAHYVRPREEVVTALGVGDARERHVAALSALAGRRPSAAALGRYRSAALP